MAGVETEVNIARIGAVHQALASPEGLNHGCHVVEVQLEVASAAILPSLFAVAQLIPLSSVAIGLLSPNIEHFSANRQRGQLAYVDEACRQPRGSPAAR